MPTISETMRAAAIERLDNRQMRLSLGKGAPISRSIEGSASLPSPWPAGHITATIESGYRGTRFQGRTGHALDKECASCSAGSSSFRRRRV